MCEVAELHGLGKGSIPADTFLTDGQAGMPSQDSTSPGPWFPLHLENDYRFPDFLVDDRCFSSSKTANKQRPNASY